MTSKSSSKPTNSIADALVSSPLTAGTCGNKAIPDALALADARHLAMVYSKAKESYPHLSKIWDPKLWDLYINWCTECMTSK